MGYVRIKRDRPSLLTQAISTLYPLTGNNFHPLQSLPREHKGRREEKSSRCGEVDRGFREGRQALVGLLFLLQGLIQQPDRVFHAELRGPLLQGTVAGDFVMLDGLRRGKHAGIECLAALVLVHDLLALVEDALDRVAGLAARRLVEQFEDLFETLHLTFGLAMMLLERRPQLVGTG